MKNSCHLDSENEEHASCMVSCDLWSTAYYISNWPIAFRTCVPAVYGAFPWLFCNFFRTFGHAHYMVRCGTWFILCVIASSLSGFACLLYMMFPRRNLIVFAKLILGFCFWDLENFLSDLKIFRFWRYMVNLKCN